MIALDASALMAVVLREPGSELVVAATVEEVSFISAVNYAEAVQKLGRRGVSEERVDRAIEGLDAGVIAFDRESGRHCARLYRVRSGLSLGDRACLGLAMSFGIPAYTTDLRWLDYAGEFGVQVVDIRER